MRRKTILAAVLCSVSSVALAQNTNTNNTTVDAQQSSQSESGSTASVGVNVAGPTFEGQEAPPDKVTIKRTPDVSAPGLVGGNPCMSGASLGVGVPGFGVTGGVSLEDSDCETRQVVALAHNMGLKGISLAHFCLQNEDLEDTLAQLGYGCIEAARALTPTDSADAELLNGNAPMVPNGQGNIIPNPSASLTRVEEDDSGPRRHRQFEPFGSENRG